MYAAPPAPPPAAPQPAAEPPSEREKVAVLPLEDSKLFRSERAELRQVLADQLAKIDNTHVFVPLTEVDSKIRPVSAGAGAACAFSGEPAERRAREHGLLPTSILHVAGFKDKGDELWVQILRAPHLDAVTWAAPWDPRLGLMDRYKASFAALAKKEGGLGLGGLAGSGRDKDALVEGSITLCEMKYWGQCDPASASWKDKARDLSSCFAGEDDITTELLVEGTEGAPRCEIADLHEAIGREGQREACLCAALGASSAMREKPGRRSLSVRFEAADLAGKPRPQIRVIDVTPNLDSEADWHSIRTERDGKAVYHSVQRLAVDNLDGLAAPLSRCAMPGGSVVVADIDVREDGVVTGARLVTSHAKKYATCLEKAFPRGAFACTDDGKAAKLRVAIAWPDKTK